MTNIESLESILPRGGAVARKDSDVISLTDRLASDGRSVLAELHRTNSRTGEATVELVRFNAAGERTASLVLRPNPDETERQIAEAMTGNTKLGLAIVSGAPVALRRWFQPLADAMRALAPGPNPRAVLFEGGCALFDPGRSLLHLVEATKLPKARAIETQSMALGGRRQVTHICVAGNFLHAAVSDPVAGFDLFRCELTKTTPSLERVVVRGAHRFALNGAIASMIATDGGLVVGTAALGHMAQPVGNWGPELLLVTGDGKWDLLIGQPRFSPHGLMLPASAQMPGMGNPQNAAIKAIAHAQGETVIAIQAYAGAPAEDRHKVAPDLFEYSGAVRLYHSSGLAEWRELKHDLPADMGALTSMCLAGRSLFIGHEGLGADTIPVQVLALDQIREARTTFRS